jgi:uncharacterized coiled-coil protein SlyX
MNTTNDYIADLQEVIAMQNEILSLKDETIAAKSSTIESLNKALAESRQALADIGAKIELVMGHNNHLKARIIDLQESEVRMSSPNC